MKRRPLVEEVQAPSAPDSVFELIKDRPYSFFLDSGMDPAKLGRYSFMGADPFLVMESRGSRITLVRGHERQSSEGNPFDVLGRLLGEQRLEPCGMPVPFVGGAVGYFGYDLRHHLERLPSTAVDDLQLPECGFAFYDAVLAFDQLERRAYVISTGLPEADDERRLKRARTRLEELDHWIRTAAATRGQAVAGPGEGGSGAVQRDGGASLRSNFTREEYVAAVSRVRDYIAAGDVFQVNLAQRFEADLAVHPYELYRRLRRINPAPFASYLNFPGVTVVSASPERFLRVQGDLVETRPVKGTRPRGRDPIEDRRLAEELVESAKDRAENVMIVDLERNDLGRVCRYGTVRVSELALLETFPTVFHLTSTISGRLRPDRSNIDLLKATFPGGSVTGAPKVRAMEIIDELEPTRRAVYTGALGYMSFDGHMDLSIVIRTILIKNGRAYFQVGGGITYDSDPEAEYVETMDKARAIIEAL
jgi:para-aminobenzoate synthetase component I